MVPPGCTFRIAGACLIALVLGQDLSRPAKAEESFWNQETILAVPYGPKQDLLDAGIDLAVNYTEFYQGIVGGEIGGEDDRDWKAGGKTDVIANFDGQKLGLWPGLSVSAHAEFVSGDHLVFPLNTALVFPTIGGYDHDLSIVVAQAFSEATTLSLGKFNMLDAASRTPLLGGGGLTTFFNTGLAAPISGVTPPYILGGILTHRTEPAVFTLMVYDPRSAQGTDVLEHPFEDGVTTSLSVTVPVTISGKTGFQRFRGVYSTQSGTDFRDIPNLILPPEAQYIGTVDGYWFGSYSFQQYLIQDEQDPTQGWGVFGQVAISDGNPNPFGWSGFLGIGGSSLLGSRPDDTFGISYFRYGLSEDLKDSLDYLNYDLDDESGIEAFYNVAVNALAKCHCGRASDMASGQ